MKQTKRRDSRGRFGADSRTADFSPLQLTFLLRAVKLHVNQLRARLPRGNPGRWTPGARNYHEWGQ